MVNTEYQYIKQIHPDAVNIEWEWDAKLHNHPDNHVKITFSIPFTAKWGGIGFTLNQPKMLKFTASEFKMELRRLKLNEIL